MNAKLAAVQLAMSVGGMLDEAQIGYLYDLAERAPDGPACEVGVWKGRSFVGWAQARKGRGPLIAVDWWYQGETITEALDQEHPGKSPAQIGNERKVSFIATIEALGLADNTRVIQSLSWDAPAQISDRLAFCFIDACHDKHAILRDTAAWPPIIAPGGILAFHDYGTRKCPAIKTAVDNWQGAAQWEALGIVGSTIAFRRPQGG
jgi:hypothetical protein